MDTKNSRKEIFRFIVLIPHRDAARFLKEYRRRLFSSGFCGALSLPAAAPLAQVSASFSAAELKELAGNLRALAPANSGKNCGKIRSSGTAFASCPGGLCPSDSDMAFYGLPLDLPLEKSVFPETAWEKTLTIISPPLLWAALIDRRLLSGGEKPVCGEAPALSFRAAALANLAIRRLDAGEKAYSFEWKLSPPVWLPRK